MAFYFMLGAGHHNMVLLAPYPVQRISLNYSMFKVSFIQGLRSNSQGCQMVCFQTKNTNLGKFWSLAMEDVFIF
jgi:hypothetical protein